MTKWAWWRCGRPGGVAGRGVPWLVLAGLMLWSSAAPATTVVALPEPELVNQSDAIGYGVVLSRTSRITPDGQPVTWVEVQVLEGLRGLSRGEIVRLQLPGGELPGGVVARVSGVPVVQPGALVFGFFQRRGGVLLPLGLSYGLLDIRWEAQTRDYAVRRDVSRLTLVSPDGAPATKAGLPMEERLSDLVSRVRTHLRSAGRPPVPVAEPVAGNASAVVGGSGQAQPAVSGGEVTR